MIPAAVGLVVVGLVLAFFLGWFGLIVAVIGIALALLYLLGVGRRAARREEGTA